MDAMTEAILELTRKNINIGYEKKDTAMIAKETDYIFTKLISLASTFFSDRINGIMLDKEELHINNEVLLSEQHQRNLLKWLEQLAVAMLFPSDLEFGRIKIDMENWYAQMGGEEMRFQYKQDYLITPKEAAEKLGVSTVTFNKFVKQGLEVVNTTAHKKVPKFVVELWKDPVYSIRMQKLFQEKKLRHQSLPDRLEEINHELGSLQKKYQALTCAEAFSSYNGDEMDDPEDYESWRDLEEEKREILKIMGAN
jgi:plasmid maintenance system antidote protein VapI